MLHTRWKPDRRARHTFLGSKEHGPRDTTPLPRNQQVLRERPLVVDPLSVAAKSRALCHLWNFFGLILVGALRPYGFVFVQHEPQAGRRNVYRLPLP